MAFTLFLVFLFEISHNLKLNFKKENSAIFHICVDVAIPFGMARLLAAPIVRNQTLNN
ncbi:hypothetical protein [Chromobacterium amazonense]|uniref:Uncharacterized protein n=1 Tax=Chromobacterium amazonense TaxID=1382803 RepID=A0ABU8UZN8_9NEIS|nr:hypothetical protein [Chromobacterium amazonense]MBM2885054.1 hypothetical protein [Chromobacterium amazonense]MDQ4541322.1 hypothetical protein [Chromobacterium amazonense]